MLVYGPFSCIWWHNLKFFDLWMCMLLDEEETVVAKNRYISDMCITLESVRDIDRVFYARFRAQQESCNARIKSFGTVKQTFRHSSQHHFVVFQ